jgi:hypothetical protein
VGAATTRFGPLQESASDIIKPMLDLPFDNKSPEGNITLTIPDQHILAAWVTMTAMTSEFLPLPMPDNDETYFTQDQRIKFRRTQRPLKGMIVSSNQYVGRNATGAYFSHSFPNILDPATEAPTGQTAELYVITLNLFHVCFQIAFYPRPNMRFAHDGHTLLGIGADPPGLTVPLWPTTASQERPAKYSLGDETFVDYCTSWHPENPAGLAVDDSAPE